MLALSKFRLSVYGGAGSDANDVFFCDLRKFDQRWRRSFELTRRPSLPAAAAATMPSAGAAKSTSVFESSGVGSLQRLVEAEPF